MIRKNANNKTATRGIHDESDEVRRDRASGRGRSGGGRSIHVEGHQRQQPGALRLRYVEARRPADSRQHAGRRAWVGQRADREHQRHLLRRRWPVGQRLRHRCEHPADQHRHGLDQEQHLHRRQHRQRRQREHRPADSGNDRSLAAGPRWSLDPREQHGVGSAGRARRARARARRRGQVLHRARAQRRRQRGRDPRAHVPRQRHGRQRELRRRLRRDELDLYAAELDRRHPPHLWRASPQWGKRHR